MINQKKAKKRRPKDSERNTYHKTVYLIFLLCLSLHFW